MYFSFFLASEMTCKALKLGPRPPILKRQEGGWTFFWSEGNDQRKERKKVSVPRWRPEIDPQCKKHLGQRTVRGIKRTPRSCARWRTPPAPQWALQGSHAIAFTAMPITKPLVLQWLPVCSKISVMKTSLCSILGLFWWERAPVSVLWGQSRQ